MSERRPEGIEGYSIDGGLFPFDAIQFTKPSASTPLISPSAGWKIISDTPVLSIADDDEFYLYDKSEAAYRKITFLSLAGAVADALGI